MDVVFGIFELITWMFWVVVEFVAASRIMRWFMATCLMVVAGLIVYAALS